MTRAEPHRAGELRQLRPSSPNPDVPAEDEYSDGAGTFDPVRTGLHFLRGGAAGRKSVWLNNASAMRSPVTVRCERPQLLVSRRKVRDVETSRAAATMQAMAVPWLTTSTLAPGCCAAMHRSAASVRPLTWSMFSPMGGCQAASSS